MYTHVVKGAMHIAVIKFLPPDVLYYYCQISVIHDVSYKASFNLDSTRINKTIFLSCVVSLCLWQGV